MTTVDRVKKLCKDNNIAISKLEKELGFSNGYIGQLRKGTLPDDRLLKIAAYFNITVAELTGEQKEKPTAPVSDEQIDAEIQKLLDSISDFSASEMAILFEQIKKIKNIRI